MDSLAFYIIVLAIPIGWFIGWLCSVIGWHFLVEKKDQTVIETRIEEEVKTYCQKKNELYAIIKNKPTNEQIDLLTQWSEQWDKKIAGRFPSKKDFFRDEFIKCYGAATFHAEKNKKMNFACKGLFWSWLILVMCIQIIYFGFIIYNYLSFASNASVLFGSGVADAAEKLAVLKTPLEPTIIAAIEAILLITGVVGALAISKRADIRKYQETWARHTRAVELMDIEMMKYIDGISPYTSTDNDEPLFASRMMDLREQNIEKFVANLETKEKDLFSDVTNLLKPTGK